MNLFKEGDKLINVKKPLEIFSFGKIRKTKRSLIEVEFEVVSIYRIIENRLRPKEPRLRLAANRSVNIVNEFLKKGVWKIVN